MLVTWVIKLSIKLIDYTYIFKEARLEILGICMVWNQFMDRRTDYCSNTVAFTIAKRRLSALSISSWREALASISFPGVSIRDWLAHCFTHVRKEYSRIRKPAKFPAFYPLSWIPHAWLSSDEILAFISCQSHSCIITSYWILLACFMISKK